MVDLNRLSFNICIGVGAIAALALLCAPTLIVLITSISAGETLRFPPQGFALHWYADLLNFPEIHAAVLNSLKVAILATAICLILGIGAALPLARSRSGWAKFVNALVMSPLILPGLSIGLALLIFFNFLGWRLSLTTLVISHVVVCVPYVVRTVLTSVSQLSANLGEASSSLGATPFYTFFHITMPPIRRGVIMGGLLAFLSSLDNLTVSIFLADARTEVLPIRLWSMIENDLDVRAAAVSGVLILATAIIMLLVDRLAGLSQVITK
jgi:putative spermidine/putrescine transport system permease protein